MKIIRILIVVPSISLAGGSGLSHISPAFWLLLLLVTLLVLGLLAYFIYGLITIGVTSPRQKWYKDRNDITESLSEMEFKMVFSDMESGVIQYDNNEQKVEVNKYQRQWFINAEQQKLKSKNVYKAHNSVDELIVSLKKYIQ